MKIQDLPVLLKDREYLNLATVSKDGQPNAVPKFFLKYEKPHIYMVDSSNGRTVENLRQSGKTSVCFMNLNNLEGYCLNGRAELIESGEVFDKLAKEVEKKILRLSADRVIEGMRSGKKNSHFELEMAEKFSVIRFKVEEFVCIEPRGDFFRQVES